MIVKKRLILLLLVFVCIVSVSASEMNAYAGITPYSFQRIIRFYSNKKINSDYAFGVDGGVRWVKNNGIVFATDLLVQDFLFENHVNEFSATISGLAGYKFNRNNKFEYEAKIGIGGNFCISGDLQPHVYFDIPIEFEVSYSLNALDLFLKVRGDAVAHLNRVLKYTCLSVVISPVIGGSIRL